MEESSSKRFLVQRYIMPFAYGIKEEQPLFTYVAIHDRIKLSQNVTGSPESIVIRVNSLC